jgi:hypothetical protein
MVCKNLRSSRKSSSTPPPLVGTRIPVIFVPPPPLARVRVFRAAHNCNSARCERAIRMDISYINLRSCTMFAAGTECTPMCERGSGTHLRTVGTRREHVHDAYIRVTVVVLYNTSARVSDRQRKKPVSSAFQYPSAFRSVRAFRPSARCVAFRERFAARCSSLLSGYNRTVSYREYRITPHCIALRRRIG